MKAIPASDSSLLVVFGDAMSVALHARTMALFNGLARLRDQRIRNLHPAYVSLLIDFDPLRLTHGEITHIVQQIASQNNLAERAPAATKAIPVCYDIEFGLDLPEVARHAGISPEKLIQLHCSPTYFVSFIGFAPGFAYLGGLPERLQMARLPTPRAFVSAGSVGIAGNQAGIYPLDSPGGWRLIGRTPLQMFHPEAMPPTRLLPGDQIKFSAIDRVTFERLQNSAEAQLSR